MRTFSIFEDSEMISTPGIGGQEAILLKNIKILKTVPSCILFKIKRQQT